LRIARAMFTEERATVEGSHHSVHGALNNPRPLRGDIPILIGGSGERKTLRLVAQYGDGCNLFGDVERVTHLLGVLDRHCGDVGRDPSEITRTRMAGVLIGATHEEAERKKAAAAEAGVPRERLEAMLLGDPDSIAEQAQAFADVGIEGLTVTLPDTYDLETVALTGRTLSAVFS
jgi:alkanesulfonate monooxygenase SsuD/methylene tetrahydromethanopterin reductase-like flavin-dependent oxidoreductase (luciferase family)